MITYTQSASEVRAGNKTIAKIYVKSDGTNELRILQGMPRDATVCKILEDCPDFCATYGITEMTHPPLFRETAEKVVDRQRMRE